MARKKRTRPWTEKHQREALRRTYEIAAECVSRGDDNGAVLVTNEPFAACMFESRWRESLERIGVAEGFTADRINREVRRVRDIAEGRKVWEVVPRFAVVRSDGMRSASFEARSSANDYANSPLRQPSHTYTVERIRVHRLVRIP